APDHIALATDSATETPEHGVPVAELSPRTEALLQNYKRAPVDFVGGEGVHLIGSDGRRYLDFVSGIAVNALGYGDAGLKAALHAAADGLIHTSNLYATSAGERLAATLV